MGWGGDRELKYVISLFFLVMVVPVFFFVSGSGG